MRHHAITTSQGVPHLPPRVICRRGLGEPYVACITTEVSRVERVRDSLGVTDGASSSVDKPSSGLHLRKHFLVEETLGLFVQRTVDGDDIALREHVLERLDPSNLDCCCRLFRERSVVEVQKLL